MPIHPPSAYMESGHWGSILSGQDQTFFTPATSFCSSGRILKASSGQLRQFLRDIFRASYQWDMPKDLTRELAMKHFIQMPEPLCLAPFHAKEALVWVPSDHRSDLALVTCILVTWSGSVWFKLDLFFPSKSISVSVLEYWLGGLHPLQK